MVGTFASGAAAFAGTTLGDMIGRAAPAPLLFLQEAITL